MNKPDKKFNYMQKRYKHSFALMMILLFVAAISLCNISLSDKGEQRVIQVLAAAKVEEAMLLENEKYKAEKDLNGFSKALGETAVMTSSSLTGKKEQTKQLTALTMNAVNEQVKSPFQAMKLSVKDYESLEKIVQAEAGGEDEKGKILVAQVILNRVNHNDFSDTVYEVVFEKIGGSAQFSPTVDGRYEQVTVTGESKAAVQKAITGKDISKGALYFSARSAAKRNNMLWFDQNLKWLFQHGAHEFYRLP